MATFNEMMQKMVNKDYEELVSVAKIAVVDVLPDCKAVDEEHDGIFMLTSLILTAIAADGYLTGLEKKMLCEITGLDAEQIKALISLYNSQMVELVDAFVDHMGIETKAQALVLITAFAAVDEKISKEETRLIKKLID